MKSRVKAINTIHFKTITIPMSAWDCYKQKFFEPQVVFDFRTKLPQGVISLEQKVTSKLQQKNSQFALGLRTIRSSIKTFRAQRNTVYRALTLISCIIPLILNLASSRRTLSAPVSTDCSPPRRAEPSRCGARSPALMPVSGYSTLIRAMAARSAACGAKSAGCGERAAPPAPAPLPLPSLHPTPYYSPVTSSVRWLAQLSSAYWSNDLTSL